MGVEQWIEALLLGGAGALACIDLWLQEDAHRPRPARPRPGSHEHCPYCRGALAEPLSPALDDQGAAGAAAGAAGDDPPTPPPSPPELVRCDRCRTVHHAACFAEHGGCATYACGGRRSLPSRARRAAACPAG